MDTSVYNIFHRFLVGDFIWSLPIIASGIISFFIVILLPPFSTKNSLMKFFKFSEFLVVFIALSICLHLIFDTPIHDFQKWWTKPLGPSMTLTERKP